jgi:hypothetical protein
LTIGTNKDFARLLPPLTHFIKGGVEFVVGWRVVARVAKGWAIKVRMVIKLDSGNLVIVILL